ncbi:MAG: COX15/CtaA family protein [Propionibacteriaceae bacterium]|nr:COX15/CtaA family protein [Propionibacteriaceae bacterium]
MRSVSPNPARMRLVYQLAAGFLFITIALGSMVCATDSSSACHAWPVCYADQVGPDRTEGWLNNPAIEFIHRLISFLALVFTAYAGWLGRRASDVRLRVFPWIALALAVGSAIFGMMIILFSLPLGLALIDVGGAIVAMTLMTIAAATLAQRGTNGGSAPVRRLGVAAFVTVLTMHLLGLIVAGKTSLGTGSFTRCLSWPLWKVLEIDRLEGLQVTRMVLAGIAIILIAAAVVKALAVPRLRAAAITLAVVLIAELGLGLLILSQGLAFTQTNGINATLAVTYAALASGVLWALGHLIGKAGATPAELAETVADSEPDELVTQSRG